MMHLEIELSLTGRGQHNLNGIWGGLLGESWIPYRVVRGSNPTGSKLCS